MTLDRRKRAASSKAVQALALAVQAGRVGHPPSPKVLAVLGAVLQALQDGADPAKVLGYTRASAGRPPEDKALQEQAVRRMLELRSLHPDLSDAKVADMVADELGVNRDTLYQNWFLGKGAKNQKTDTRVERTYRGRVRKITKLRAKLERQQWESAEDAVDIPPMPDRPEASEDFPC